MQSTDLSYRTLLDVTNALNSQRDTESLWGVITELIKQVTPWERAGITLYEQKADSFRFYELETTVQTPMLKRDAVIPRKGSAVGWVYEHHRIHVRPDLSSRQEFLEDDLYHQEGLRRMINLPLLMRDACFGTLNIGSVQAGEPAPEELEFLQQVAIQIAFAIDHVQAYEQINRLREQLARENEYLVEEIKSTHNFGTMVGTSEVFQKVLSLVKAVGPTSTAVLISGETGTGKELLARRIHELSPRRQKPMVRVNCAALPAGLVESELFGHERGAFTGADHRRLGRFELANGGTLFLDEIGEMPLEAQAKLLRVLEDGQVERVGGIQAVTVDVRMIAATNADLVAAIAEGRFRPDLFYRLHVFPIVIPPLRDRPEDIPLLSQHFLERYRAKLKRPPLQLSAASMKQLSRYPWPGNIRELQNVIERAVILAQSSTVEIDPQCLSLPLSRAQEELPVNFQDMERLHLLRVLDQTHWRLYGDDGAAARLGLNPSTLRSRLKKLGLKRPGHTSPSEPRVLHDLA
jgi:formate hydrogenlyase transcriptional activator